MSERRFLVIRVTYSEDGHNFIKKELAEGRLRQGWGPVPLKPEGAPSEYNPEPFVRAYCKAWKASEAEARKRYNILYPMLEIKPGDLIVIPKTPDARHFTIAEAAGTYQFDLEIPRRELNKDDFGHVIPVGKTKKVGYEESLSAREVSKAFRAYQSAVNNIWKSSVQDAILSLWEYDSHASQDRHFTDEMRDKLLNTLRSHLSSLAPKDVERLIARALEQAGYRIEGRNRFDGQGADTDLILRFRLPLLGDLQDNFVIHVYIQIKHKLGVDRNDTHDIEQLAAFPTEEKAIKILITTADNVSDEAYELAHEKGVWLISGDEALVLLARGIGL